MKSCSPQPKPRLSRLTWAGLVVVLIGTGWVQAGDILRGGAGNGGAAAQRNATARSNAGSAEAAQASANAKDRLARTTQAIQAVRNMQQKAGATAVVPDGLQPGGLKVLTGPNARWDGAAAPVQSGGEVKIVQNDAQALLHWETFNIGRGTTVNFDQSAGKADASKWVAFNKVFDPSGQPSQILGSIKAEGQVYVINQNGIIFGAGSQVNTRTLVASSLPINDNLIQRGLLNNPDSQFVFTGLALPAGASGGTPAFIPPVPLTVDGRIGDVVVEAGASITASVSAEGNGGRIMLVGPNVSNSGTLEARAGQAILAAGLQVGIAAHSENDPSLRGLDVFVGQIGDYAAAATNNGIIYTPRGNAFLTGKSVNQMGVIDSSTSVSLNGRIDLMAVYGATSLPPTGGTTSLPFTLRRTGAVTLGPDSVTRVLPELESSEKVVGLELSLPSLINAQGFTVNMGKNAVIMAPGARLPSGDGAVVPLSYLTSFSAGVQLSAGTYNGSNIFGYTGGQIYLGQGSLIDVSGTAGVVAQVNQNILTLQMRGSELADSPLQRNGIVRGLGITVDVRRTGTWNGRTWIGTPLGDVSGFAGLIERTSGELTVAGGTVHITAGESVVARAGSVIDVSGGWTDYQSGIPFRTSRLLTDGQLVNIEDATPDRIYDGVYTGQSVSMHQKWGVAKMYAGALAPLGGDSGRAYIQGAASGEIVIQAPSMALDGELLGQSVVGPRQVRSSPLLSSIPQQAALTLRFKAQDAAFNTISPTPPEIILGATKVADAVGEFSLDALGNPISLNDSRRKNFGLPENFLAKTGFGSLTIENSDGDVLVPQGVVVETSVGGSLTVSAKNITVEGSILSPGGHQAFTVYNYSPYAAALLKQTPGAITPDPMTGRGVFYLGSESVLSAAGTSVDERLVDPLTGLKPLEPNAGSISVVAYSIDLAAGSRIDVMGGSSIGSNGKMAFGNGGSITLTAGQDPGLRSILGGELNLKAELLGYSAAKGGSLAIQAPLIQVGGTALTESTFLVQPEFFNQGGFTSFTLTGLGAPTRSGLAEDYLPAVSIAPGTVIEPVVQTLAVAPTRLGEGFRLVPSSLAVADRYPVSIAFRAPGVENDFSKLPDIRGDILMPESAQITTDPGATVSFDGQTVTLLGRVTAPAGVISISGASSYPTLKPSVTEASATVYLGDNAHLSTAGVALFQSDPYGRRRGDILPGGLIAISGNVVSEAGAVLDVSGASAIFDLTPAELGLSLSPERLRMAGITSERFAAQSMPYRLESDGGTIRLHGSEMLLVNARMIGEAGGASAVGGTLEVSSGRFYLDGSESTTADLNLIVSQNGSANPSAQVGIGQALRDQQGNILSGMGYFSVGSFVDGGFSALTLGGNVNFVGPVDIVASRQLKVATGGVIFTDSAVTLTAPYVALGQTFRAPSLPTEEVRLFEKTDSLGTTTAYAFAPTFGTGSLTVKADLIDVGTLSLQHVGSASLDAGTGQIRGGGTVNIAGDLSMRAAAIYPVTKQAFNIFAYDHSVSTPTGSEIRAGSVTIRRSGYVQSPLSAQGSLSIYASVIDQGGVLLAPFGTINLGWDGTGTAPVDPLAGISILPLITNQITLADGSFTSVAGLDYRTGAELLVPYGINPDGLAWIDPSGLDITTSGLTGKGISVSGKNLNFTSTSSIDIRGGGDLFAYRWIQGNGGTTDILASSGSFAIIAGYQNAFAPVAPFNTSSTATNLEGDPGYVNAGLSVGDSIYLQASNGLPAGVYTLLPARYALLPGAFLVTPTQNSSIGTLQFPDGSSSVYGYQFNTLPSRDGVATKFTQFEVLPADVIASRAEYELYSANGFFTGTALARESVVSPLPADAGHLVFAAGSSLNLAGQVLAQRAAGGRGAMLDISATSDIFISDGASSAPLGAIQLSASQLTGFGAESMLIGGIRTVGPSGTSVRTATSNLYVDSGASLSAPEIILVSKGDLTVAAGASVVSSGSLSRPAETLLLSGDGTLLRVSGDTSAAILRTGFTGATGPALTIGAGAVVGGASLILDSSSETFLDPNAILIASAISLNSGRIAVVLDNPGAVPAAAGLVLSGVALSTFESATQRTLLSYSSIDFYGTGQLGVPGGGAISLRAGELRGFNQNGGTVRIVAESILLDNSQKALATGGGALDGTLVLDTGKLTIGVNDFAISRFASTEITATQGVLGRGVGGLSTAGRLTLTTPLITGAQGATQTITAQGTLVMQKPSGGGIAGVTGGLGTSLTLTGASIVADSDILLPSGLLALKTTSGDLVVGGRLDVSGTAQTIFDLVQYTDAGTISLSATGGNLTISQDAVLSVSAALGGGNAGTLLASAADGTFTADGSLRGSAGSGWKSGTFGLDVRALPSLSGAISAFGADDFAWSRSFRVRTGDLLIDGVNKAHNFSAATDTGSILVTGTIDASGATGGKISLLANKNLVLDQGSLLDASGVGFDHAGKGGEVNLAAGSSYNGVVGTGSVDIRQGSKIDLTIDAKDQGIRPSAFYGEYTGKLHIRAPQINGGTDLAVNAIDGEIVGASAIQVEGYRIYDLTASGGVITKAVQNSILADGQSFLGASGTTTARYTAMMNRLLANNASLQDVLVLAPGAEIINRTGDLTLGTATSTSSGDWDLAGFRFGAKGAAGVLTMRAAGNLIFYNTLSDGFQAVTSNAAGGWSTMWLATLMAQNTRLPTNLQSWSYNLTAGADLAAANALNVRPLAGLAADKGSVQIGKNIGQALGTSGANATTARVIGNTATSQNNFQVIRTGTGDINVAAGRDVQLLNQFATIYTAGAAVADPTTVYQAGDFSLPVLVDEEGFLVTVPQGTLGNYQQVYPAQYSLAGGNIAVSAQRDIGHYTKNGTTLVADSSRQIPTNWLMRRSYVDGTGHYGSFTASGSGVEISDPAMSTTWWIDFSNFFEGIGALGGGNVSLTAGRDVVNVDAFAPTNARAPKGLADPSLLLEYGGGDLTVEAGRNIDGGIYYVERGAGTLFAGGEIKTNATRSPSLGLIRSFGSPEVFDERTFLPTTLFLGKGQFDVSARGNVLIGPTLNAFLTPQGLTNRSWYKTAFSTYASSSSVDVSSLGGDINFRLSTILPTANSAVPIFQAWLQKQNQFATAGATSLASNFYPWLRLTESNSDGYRIATSVMPPTLTATSFSGDINIGGDIRLFPSATGNLQLAARDGINGLRSLGLSNNLEATRTTLDAWYSSTIFVSDASPSRLPGIASAASILNNFANTSNLLFSQLATSSAAPLSVFNASFNETPVTNSVINVKQALHASSLLHSGDDEPVRLYAGAGDISDLRFFSPKKANILASRDIRNIAFYIQNVSQDDFSLVQAGRDIILYDSTTAALKQAASAGNLLIPGSGAQAGDIQISGPGTLGVFAGRDLDLGVGPSRADGTGLGITSIGNARNPYLPFGGADVIAGAGMNVVAEMMQTIDVDAFLAEFGESSDYQPYLAALSRDSDTNIESMSDDAKRKLALQLLFLVLRDTGRNVATTGSYDTGFTAIDTLFTNVSTKGDIKLRGRDIRTKNGGYLNLLAPSGGLSLASTSIGNPLTPPGIVTERGGAISIFTQGDVNLGIGRIFTLRGGDIVIWSSEGDIAAGSAAKTVRSAPPTRVLIDPQSATVETDLAGLATGGGIGVLATVAGVPPGDVDLIAPVGTVDAGDAGVRATGNLSIAAVQVLNADNLSVGGTSSGVPSQAPPAAPNIGGLTSASNATGATSSAASQVANQSRQAAESDEALSTITAEVLGYGGGDDEEEEKKKEG